MVPDPPIPRFPRLHLPIPRRNHTPPLGHHISRTHLVIPSFYAFSKLSLLAPPSPRQQRIYNIQSPLDARNATKMVHPRMDNLGMAYRSLEFGGRGWIYVM